MNYVGTLQLAGSSGEWSLPAIRRAGLLRTDNGLNDTHSVVMWGIQWEVLSTLAVSYNVMQVQYLHSCWFFAFPQSSIRNSRVATSC